MLSLDFVHVNLQIQAPCFWDIPLFSWAALLEPLCLIISDWFTDGFNLISIVPVQVSLSSIKEFWAKIGYGCTEGSCVPNTDISWWSFETELTIEKFLACAIGTYRSCWLSNDPLIGCELLHRQIFWLSQQRGTKEKSPYLAQWLFPWLKWPRFVVCHCSHQAHCYIL